MDLELDGDQQAVVDAVRAIMKNEAGADRARALGVAGHDDALLTTLEVNGFLDLFHSDPLGAALVAEEASRHNARINAAIRLLVAPALLGPDVTGRFAVTRRHAPGPVRFGQHAEAVLILDGEEAFVAQVVGATAVASPYGFPYALVETGDERPLGAGSGVELEQWWRVALAVEIAGAADGALAHTVEYLSHRKQFGKPLGSLQAVQHRLAEAYVTAEGAKLLARRAAFSSGAAEHATAAAAYATQAAQIIGTDMHQLSGAIGFTTEFDLQLWTTRLHALRVELGGMTNHQVATATAHWG